MMVSSMAVSSTSLLLGRLGSRNDARVGVPCHYPVKSILQVQSQTATLRVATLRGTNSSRIRPGRGHPLTSRSQAEDSAPVGTVAEAATVSADPQIKLQFVGPNNSEVAEFSLGSGTKNLRRAMLDAKVPLYDMYGSLMNCGGGGSCGTCMVDIKEGGQLLSEKTTAEDRYLKKRPESWRLACQTIVGDKTNSGTVIVRTMPQKN